ncbi:outer membrane protein assembly factor BamE [Sphingosinicella sp. LHD-64]|uniref:outer membrane protein assembly factor BamE domain-containing protein n=1 Tax=Sphingosinicella sp. LHD-64 TaxID=3072139 RepID=UPI00280F44E2|nr:outer membrane protein assembly factor BamE [Sphingosinicella sp. LHD-64]MDQ8754664.1 outer membrane protein assembly factor BamE [Sphingosinicella sp. LHD-64]
MNLRTLFIASFVGAGLVAPTAAPAEDDTGYVGTIDPSAFRETPRERDRLGATVDPAAVRMITPGIDKFSIYRLIGPPHFNEAIARRWNYILVFPSASGSEERLRCRMEIRFAPPARGRYNVTVSEVVWQDRSCAERVAAAG